MMLAAWKYSGWFFGWKIHEVQMSDENLVSGDLPSGSQGSTLNCAYMTFTYTPPKTNMEPENTLLEKETQLQTTNFWVSC